MKNPIWDVVKFKKRDESTTINKALKSVPIFSDLKQKELDEIAKIIHRRTYKAGEPVFRMGDPGLGMYIIISGSVAIIEDLKEEKHHIVDLVAGTFFGDLALLDESPRSASAIANEDCDILGFFRPDLMDILYRTPKTGIKIVFALAKIVGERLRRTNLQMTELQKKVEESSRG